MEDWQKEFIEIIETLTVTVEQFFQEVNQSIQEVVEDIHQEIFSDFEQFWQEFIEPIIEINIDINVETEANFSDEFIEDPDFFLNLNHDLDLFLRNVENEANFSEDFVEDPDLFLSPKIEPTINIHPACIGCCHYHGRVYNGNLLVCGMHPYGWDDSHCPDWEE